MRNHASPIRSASACLITLALFAAIFTLLAPSARADDWPAFRHDIARSGATDEKLTFPLRLAWSYTCAQLPRPAWPDTFRLLNRVDFDYAPAPVIAEGIVCFGSTADDTVRALDVKTGQEKWHFVTGGPVRFAPQIVTGKAYFASDDGYAYCVDAATGKLAWKFRGGPYDEQIVINHRMSSRWPIRTGVLVSDGVVYITAGMMPAEGIYIYALDAETGAVLWCNDTSGLTPQGAMLASANLLLIPNANQGASAINRRTGNVSNERGPAPLPGGGGTFVTIDGNTQYNYAIHRSGVLFLQPTSLIGAKPARPWGAGVVPQVTINAQPGADQIHEKAKVSAIVRGGKPYVRKSYGIALAGDTLLLGLDGSVVAERIEPPKPGEQSWKAPVSGEAREIAIANGHLFVSTDRGVIYCFAPATAEAAAPISINPASTLPKPEKAAPMPVIANIKEAGMDRGFALVLGDSDGKASLALAAETQLQIITAITDQPAATALRERLLAETTLYGSRIHVQFVERLDRLPFPQFFANTVLVVGASPGVSAKELYRVLHPCGGILLAPGLDAAGKEQLMRESGATEKETTRSGSEPCIVRGKLPGALDWDTNRKEYAVDQRIKWPLRPLWIGGPSTAQVQNFGEDAVGPTAANGRYFMLSEHALTAIDAYNGEVLWSRPIPKKSPGTRMVDEKLHIAIDPTPFGKTDLTRHVRASDDDVFLDLGTGYSRGKGTGWIRLNARTGEQRKVSVPYNPPTETTTLKPDHTWPLAVDALHSGAVKMEASSDALTLTLTTNDAKVTPLDAWELSFDCRPVDARYGLYDRGAFRVRVAVSRDGAPAAWSPLTGTEFPKIKVTGERDAGGTKTTVVIPRDDLKSLVGTAPLSFDFAATLNSHDGGANESILRRHLFGDWAADGINNGWARIVLSEASQAEIGKQPAVIFVPPPAAARWACRKSRGKSRVELHPSVE